MEFSTQAAPTREVLLALMMDAPAEGWALQEIRAELIGRGWMDGEPDTTRALGARIAKMADRRHLELREDGRYRLGPRHDGARPRRDSSTSRKITRPRKMLTA